MPTQRQSLTREELHQATYDDEPYPDQQRREDAEAIAALDRGEGITTGQLNRELGL